MTSLPPILLRAPRIFYALAVLVFFASIGLTIFEIENTMTFTEPGNPVVRLARLRGIYQACLEAIYIAGTGVLTHILLAIWQDGRIRPVDGGDS